MAYDFNGFLERLDGNWYGDDALLQELVKAKTYERQCAVCSS